MMWGLSLLLKTIKLSKFQIFVGGGQGERNGKPSMACFGQPLAQVDEADLLKTLDAVVKVHQHWGDRENRVWARVKFVVKKMGIDWYREQVEKILGVNWNYLTPIWIRGPVICIMAGLNSPATVYGLLACILKMAVSSTTPLTAN